MFAIQSPQKQSLETEIDTTFESCTPNILPCRIHHDGPVGALERHWTPKSDGKDTASTAYFRGRKLRARRVEIPEGYQGVIATPTDRLLPSTRKNNNFSDDAELEPEEPVKILEQQGSFDHFMVWEHEVAPAADDRFVKGVEEWLKLAEAMHSDPKSVEENEKKTST